MDCGTLYNKFKELGCGLNTLTPHDVNWMSDEPSMKQFISWFLENISADNVLNDGELEEYQEICGAGEELHGEALDQALREAGYPIDDLPIDDFDILEEKDEIGFLKGQVEALSLIEERVQSRLEKEKKESVLEQKKLQEGQRSSFQDGQVLMKFNVQIKNSLSNFYQSLQQLTFNCLNYKHAGKCQFLAQAPLEDFLMLCNTFEQNVKLFIKRQFEGRELAGKSNIHLLPLLSSDDFDEQENLNMFNNATTPHEFKIHPKKLWEAEVRRVCAQAKLKSVQAVLEHMESYKKSLNISTLRFSVLECKQDCSILEAEIDLLRQHEVSTAAQNFVVAKIAAIAEDFARGRCERRRHRLNRLVTLQKTLSRDVLLTDVLWMLLRREKKLVNLAAEFINESVTFLNEEYDKHIAVMELHQEIHQKQSAFEKAAAMGQLPLFDSVRRLMGIEETKDMTSLVNAIKELSARVELLDRNGFMMKPLDLNLSLEKSLRSLQESLFTGPTRELLLIPADIAHNIGCVENSIEEFDTSIRRLQRNFVSKQELYAKFPIQRDSRLLWAWFLVAPPQLFAALKRAEDASEKRKESRLYR